MYWVKTHNQIRDGHSNNRLRGVIMNIAITLTIITLTIITLTIIILTITLTISQL